MSLDLRNEYKRVGWGLGFGSSMCRKALRERRSSGHFSEFKEDQDGRE